MGGGSGYKPKPPPPVAPPATPVEGDEASKSAEDAMRKRERLASGRRSTLLTQGTFSEAVLSGSQNRKTLLG